MNTVNYNLVTVFSITWLVSWIPLPWPLPIVPRDVHIHLQPPNDDPVELFCQVMSVFNLFESNKSIPPSIIIPFAGYNDFPHVAPLSEVIPELLLRDVVRKSSEVKG